MDVIGDSDVAMHAVAGRFGILGCFDRFVDQKMQFPLSRCMYCMICMYVLVLYLDSISVTNMWSATCGFIPRLAA